MASQLSVTCVPFINTNRHLPYSTAVDMLNEYRRAFMKQILAEISAQLKKFDEVVCLQIFECAGAEDSLIILCDDKIDMSRQTSIIFLLLQRL